MFLCFGKYVFQGRAPQNQAREAWEFSRWPRALGAEARGDNTKKRTPSEIEGVDLGKRPKGSPDRADGVGKRPTSNRNKPSLHIFDGRFLRRRRVFAVAITSVDAPYNLNAPRNPYYLAQPRSLVAIADEWGASKV